MSSSNNINIRIATLNDHDIILTGFRKFYEPDEPLLSGFIDKTPMTSKEEECFLSLLEENLSLIALKGDKLVGYFLNGSFNRETSEKINNFFGGDLKSNKNFVALGQIMDILDSKVDVFERYNIKEFFCLCSIGVDPEFRGQSIGQKLFEKSFEIGKQNGFKFAIVDCTSKYSAQIAERVGMEFVTSLKYSDYKNKDGKAIFQPSEEHTHLKRFVKML